MDSEYNNFDLPVCTIFSTPTLLTTDGKNHIFLVKNVKIFPRELSALEPFFIEMLTALIMTNKMVSLNQKGKKIVGILLNILHEIFIPPRMENGSNKNAPRIIKKSLSPNWPIPSFRLSKPPNKKERRQE